MAKTSIKTYQKLLGKAMAEYEKLTPLDETRKKILAKKIAKYKRLAA